MTSLLTMGISITVVLAALLGVLIHFAVKGRLSRGTGGVVVVAACLLWHTLAWVSLDHASGLIHRALFVTIIVPFGFGFGEGNAAFLIALAVQATFACLVSVGVYLTINMKTESRTNH